MSKEKEYRIIVLNDDGTPNKEYNDKMDKVDKMTDDEKLKYFRSLHKFRPYPKYNLLEIFYDNYIKYFTQRLIKKNEYLNELTYKEQFYFIANEIKKLEFIKFTKKNLKGIDISNNGIIKIYSEWLNIHKKYLDAIQPFENSQAEKAFVKSENKKPKTTYQWQSNPDKELPELYSLMIDKHKLIAPETTYEQFKATFTGQPIESIEPIKWHQKNASELLYFIDRLEQSNNIVHNPKRANYQRMTACFVKPDGKPFKANWKQIKQNISINLSPDKQKAIDKLINNF